MEYNEDEASEKALKDSRKFWDNIDNKIDEILAQRKGIISESKQTSRE